MMKKKPCRTQKLNAARSALLSVLAQAAKDRKAIARFVPPADPLAELALVSRQERALRDFSANGAPAAPRLGEYFFDVTKALMPEREPEPINFHTPNLNDDQKIAVRTIMSAPAFSWGVLHVSCVSWKKIPKKIFHGPLHQVRRTWNVSAKPITLIRRKKSMGKHTASKLKCGWNWQYRFTEEVQPDGTRKTLIVFNLLHRSKFETSVVISGNPGSRLYEQNVMEAIGIASREFFQELYAAEVAWERVRVGDHFDGWLVDAPIDSNLIRAFAADLEAINRVNIIMPDDAGEAAK